MTEDDSDDSQKAVHATVEEPARSVTISAGSTETQRVEVASGGELDAGAELAGRYQIEATLGRGGSGTVYRAWDRVLGEPIAVKILRPDRARERSWIKRLAREVKVARAIRHPNHRREARGSAFRSAPQRWKPRRGPAGHGVG